jgi:alkylresorcinol/alkylpyrone synthase
MAKANPGAKVLFLVVELCALTFRKDDLTKSNIVATALFGDGAAGAILSTDGDGPALIANGEHTWPQSLDIMGWDVQEDGLKAIFSQSIPSLVANEYEPVLYAFLQKNDLKLSDISHFACHPGGAKVLDALEIAFKLAPGELKESREALRNYGNMSAATVMFVLERMDWRAKNRRTLLTALGPGFSAVFAVLQG